MPLSPTRQNSQDRQFEFLAALSHPLRLRVLKHLLCEEMSVNSLKRRLRKPQHAVSRHLAVMRRAGIVTQRISGPERIYSVPRDLRRIQRGVPVLDMGCCTFRSDQL
jgi:DNA-binding transcriptional ArsR family regulator